LQTLQYVSALIKAITEFFPDAPILGTTTAGEIMDGAALDRTTVISFACFEKTRVSSALVGQNDDLFDAGLALAATVAEAETKLVIVFGCGIKNGGAINGEPLLAAFQKACPGVLVAGAQAGDNGVARNIFLC
jgi:c-di-GMP phosphodiesterase